MKKKLTLTIDTVGEYLILRCNEQAVCKSKNRFMIEEYAAAVEIVCKIAGITIERKGF